jgi:hypothetical protein
MVAETVAAPAPGSPKTANLSKGAGDGFECLPSPDKAKALLLEMKCWGVRVYPAENPWNGWVVPLSDETEAVASFESGIFFLAYQHILRCKLCRRKNGLSVKAVKAILRELEEEWTRKIQGRRQERTVLVIEDSCRLILIREVVEGEERRTFKIDGYLTRENPSNWMSLIKTAGIAWTFHGNLNSTLEYLTSYLGLETKIKKR